MTEKSEISTKKAWFIILISLIDDIIILGLIGLAVWYFKISLPVWAWIIIGLALAAFIFVRTWVVLPALRRKKVTGAEGMIGQVGEVVESVTPGLVVRVSGEYSILMSTPPPFQMTPSPARLSNSSADSPSSLW